MDNYTALSKKYSDNSLIRTVVNIIPYVGGSLDLLLTDKWNKFYQRRIDNMLQQISNDIKQIEDKIDEEYIETEEFFDIILKILKEASQTRLDEKRKLYSKILRDSISGSNNKIYLESIIDIISTLNEIDLFFINRIEEFLKVSTIKDYFTADGISTYNPTDYKNIDDITRVLYRFSYLGLLDFERTTVTKKEFVKFTKTPLFVLIIKYLQE